MSVAVEIVFTVLLLFIAAGIYDLVRVGVESMFDVGSGVPPSVVRPDACPPQAPSPLRRAGTFPSSVDDE